MNPPSREPQSSSSSGAAALCFGLLVYLVLQLTSLPFKSATFDEGAHIPAGYTYLKFRDYRLNPEHPPLIKSLAALPLLALDATVKEDESWRLRRQWEFGRRFLYRWNDADRMLFWARLPIVALGACLALAVFFWTRRHWGPRAATLALLLCVLNPDVLAHSQIVTTDAGLALFVFLAVISFERWLDGARWTWVVWAGLATGAAFATKFSAPALVPILVAVGLVGVARPSETARARRPSLFGRARALLVALVLIALLAWGVVWASYGFEPRLARDAEVARSVDWTRVMPDAPLARAAVLAVRRTGVLPEPYVFGLLRVLRHSESRPAFVAGELSSAGWWYYFPLTFAIKTPLALIALVLIAIATRRRHAAHPRVECAVWLPPLIYAVCVASRHLDIGHRHLLPIYPFLFVAGGRAAAWAAQSASGWARALVIGLAAWQVGATAFIAPHYLAYFNELIGGPRNGYRYLVDSNLDWGQDLKGLKRSLDRHGIGHIKLSYFGSADPRYYGIDCDLLPGEMNPPPKEDGNVRPGDIVAVSATNLQGVYLEDQGRALMAQLRARRPIDTIGYSIFLYRTDFSWSRQ